jgi:signal transduction histidine kinase
MTVVDQGVPYQLALPPAPLSDVHVLDSGPASLGLAVAVWTAAIVATSIGLLSRSNEVARLARLADQAKSQQVEAWETKSAQASERTRISRDIHDIVAHSLSVIIAQADGGRYAAKADPEAAVRALEAIALTGRDALADLRGIVRFLREGPPDETVQLSPAPHVRDLDGLVTDLRDAGLDVALVRIGSPGQLPPGVGTSLQRIAQEALTNCLKHAGPQVSVTVTDSRHPNRIELTVSDDGRGAAADNDGGGHGLLGMRERAEALGGQFTAGPRATGGFRVWVAVPLPRSQSTAAGIETRLDPEIGGEDGEDPRIGGR